MAGTLPITGTFSGDGIRELINTFSPGTGELFYVDEVVLTSDGTGGSNVNSSMNVGIFDATIGPPNELVYQGAHGVQGTGVTDNAIRATTDAVGAYLTADETLGISKNAASSTASWTYCVKLRQIL